jgi:hypothetical protein
MEHPTALVTDDATPPATCACQRYIDAGWRVRCAACGRDTIDGRGVAAYLPPVEIADGEYAVEPDGDGFGIEPCDMVRDDELADAAERAVA